MALLLAFDGMHTLTALGALFSRPTRVAPRPLPTRDDLAGLDARLLRDIGLEALAYERRGPVPADRVAPWPFA